MSDPEARLTADSGTGLRGYIWGPVSALGLTVALVVCAADQATKNYLLSVYDLGAKGVVSVAPFLDFVLAWNKGISYSLFPQEGTTGQGLLVAFKLFAVVCLWVWLCRSQTRLTAVALGLIVGGALGNAIDGARFGAVVDFVYFHITTATWNFSWYIFNLADVAIVAGVAGLLYESLVGDRAVKAPRSGA
jgi:signal peptidase II